MNERCHWTVPVLAAALAGAVGFVAGSRLRAPGWNCQVDTYWWFGWWVRCLGGQRCPSGTCVLQRRRAGSEENWADVDVVEGGSVRWNSEMEYRCRCR